VDRIFEEEGRSKQLDCDLLVVSVFWSIWSRQILSGIYFLGVFEDDVIRRPLLMVDHRCCSFADSGHQERQRTIGQDAVVQIAPHPRPLKGAQNEQSFFGNDYVAGRGPSLDLLQKN
jgi:hypothetical protein